MNAENNTNQELAAGDGMLVKTIKGMEYIPAEEAHRIAEFIGASGNSNVFTSRYKIGDPVALNFGTAGKIQNCEIAEVHFCGSNVRYDIVIVVGGVVPDAANATVIDNVDSAMVENREGFVDEKYVVPDSK